MGYRYFSYRYTMTTQHSGKLNVCHLSWRPATDCYESAHKIYITTELAGIDSNQVDVLLYENALVLKGQRRLGTHKHSIMYHTAEIRQGPFFIEIPLSVSVNPEDVDIHSKNGLLTITLVKREQHGK